MWWTFSLTAPFNWKALSLFPHMAGSFPSLSSALEPGDHSSRTTPSPPPSPSPTQSAVFWHVIGLLTPYSSLLFKIMCICFLIYYLSLPHYNITFITAGTVVFSTHLSAHTRKCCTCLAHSRLSINISE